MTTDTRIREKEVLEAFHAFYEFWAARQHRDDVQKLLDFCEEGVTVIGTAAHEILVGVEAYRELITADLDEVPDILEIKFPWSRAKVIEDAAIVEAKMELNLPVDGSLQSIGFVHITQVYRNQDNRWLIEHIHMSFPSSDQTEDEVWPTEALKARNRELERQVADRTAALEQSLTQLKATQAQLIQAEKMASLGQLTAGIAHEIKNPLNFVNNFAEVNEELADELDEAVDAGDTPESLKAIIADLKQNAQVIAQHGKRADSIVHAMMQHASGGTGERLPTDVNRLVEEQLSLAYHGKRAQMTGFNATLERDLDAEAGAVAMVPQEIGRVVLNLLSNAFDAVHEQASRVKGPYEPIVKVSTCRNGETVSIRIADNGPGIPEAIREKIFEPFFTTKPTGSGTGLGLSLSYDIVTQGHGGTLTVESTEGEGATFVVTLPCVV